eukprot:5960263-Prymnesium_polylepis.1
MSDSSRAGRSALIRGHTPTRTYTPHTNRRDPQVRTQTTRTDKVDCGTAPARASQAISGNPSGSNSPRRLRVRCALLAIRPGEAQAGGSHAARCPRADRPPAGLRTHGTSSGAADAHTTLGWPVLLRQPACEGPRGAAAKPGSMVASTVSPYGGGVTPTSSHRLLTTGEC